MSYTINARQTIAYTDRFDVYRMSETLLVNANGVQIDPVFDTTPVYSGVRCLWMNRADINSPGGAIGRSLAESSDVLDVIHFPVGVTIKDQYALHCKTTGHPQYGEWFIVQGFGALRPERGKRKGNYLQIRAKRMLAPPGLEGIT